MLVIEPACKSERQFLLWVAIGDDVAVAVVLDFTQYVPSGVGDDARTAELVGKDVIPLIAFIVRSRCVTYCVFVAVFQVFVTVKRGQQAGFVFPEVFFNDDAINQFGNAITEGVVATIAFPDMRPSRCNVVIIKDDFTGNQNDL